MVVSVNPDPSKDQFHRLLDSALAVLNDQARRNPSKIEKLRGNKLEPYARDILANLAVGTEFEDSIELIGGQKFPDIVANKFFGVEVKTTIKNHWRTTGNSVMESTRVEEVEQIFMLFGKLGAPIEFKCRPYEECLSEIVVTHSPRYLIDMNLALGHTIFDKINTSYDTLRNQENPVREIANYYQSKLKPGQELWWIQDTDRSSSLVISVWSSLTLKEKSYLKLKAMILFPEIFSGKGDKFARVSLWLVTVQSIVCPNVRDLFTAGGKGNFTLQGERYGNVPRIYLKLFTNFRDLIAVFRDISSEDLVEYWGVEVADEGKVAEWIRLVVLHSKSVQTNRFHRVNEILEVLMKTVSN